MRSRSKRRFYLSGKSTRNLHKNYFLDVVLLKFYVNKTSSFDSIDLQVLTKIAVESQHQVCVYNANITVLDGAPPPPPLLKYQQ